MGTTKQVAEAKSANNKTKTPKRPASKKSGSITSRTKAKVAAAAKATIGHPGIGMFVKGLLVSGKSTDEILNAVAKKFPGCGTSRSSVAWYRSKLHKEGKV